MSYAVYAAAFAVCYLIGNVNFAILYSKFIKKDDIRSHGSKNAGSTNVLRTYGKSAAALTFVGDMLKGVVAILLSRWASEYFSVPYTEYVGGFAVVLGHIYPALFGFKGGKGIATGLGLLCALDPIAFAIVAFIFIPIAPLSGFVSLASVMGAACFPVIMGLVHAAEGAFDLTEVLLAAVISCVLVFSHRANIKRLLNRTENMIYLKKPKQ